MRGPLALVLVLSLVAPFLAGCTDDGDDNDRGDGPSETGSPSPVPTTPGGSRLLVAGARPIWYTGLQWTFAVDNARAGVQGNIMLVVVAEDDEVWQLAPGNGSDEDVVMWSLFAHLPPLGPVSKTTFAPHLHGSAVSWFDFPLREGKTWSAEDHNGRTINYTATATETTLFDGRRVPAFEVVGLRGDVTWLRYIYTAEVAFFVTASLDGDGDGAFDLDIRMTDARPGTMQLSTPTFEPVDLARLNDQGPTSITTPATSYTFPSGAEDLYVFFVLGGGPGRYTGSITLPGGAVKSFNFTNTNQTPVSVVQGGHFVVAPGDGNIGSLILGDGSVRAELFAVHRNGP